MVQTLKALIITSLIFLSSNAMANPRAQDLDYKVVQSKLWHCLFDYSGGGDSAGGRPSEMLPDAIPESIKPRTFSPGSSLEDFVKENEGDVETPTPVPNGIPKKISLNFVLEESDELKCWQQVAGEYEDIYEMREILSVEIQRLLEEGRIQEAKQLVFVRSSLYDHEDI